MPIKKLAMAFVLVLLGSTQALHAQMVQVKTTGIPDQLFDYAAAAQVEDAWCWAASIQMILRWYRIPASQAEIVAHAYGAVVNATGSSEAVSRALSGPGRDQAGNVRMISSLTFVGAPQPAVLVAELRQRHPILLGIQISPWAAHAVVITGAQYIDTPNGPLILTLIIRDPSPTPINVQNQGRVVISQSELPEYISHVRQHWRVQVN